MIRAQVVPIVIEQHAEELATIWAVRSGLRAAGHVRLRQLARFDERIAAHQDGCVIGGPDAVRILTAQLASVSAGRVFAAAVVAFDLNDRATIDRCLALAEVIPDARHGMKSALGWVSSVRLRGIVKDLLTAASPIRRSLGLAACRLHGVDPGTALSVGITSPDHDVRTEAIRAAAVLGKVDVPLPASLDDADGTCEFWLAWTAVLLGDRGAALRTLTDVALADHPHRGRAFRLMCQANGAAAAHEALRRLAGDSTQMPWLLEGSGIVGDPAYGPWLIRHMQDDATALRAGQAFSLMTGADLSGLKLDRPRPEGIQAGPNDDPADPNVEMNSDDELPWPDVDKVAKWWAANGSRFQKGARYFMGQPVTKEHCVAVLKNGYQRQRILAANYLCLLEPGTPFFNTSAPAWRQQRLLAAM